MVVASITVQLVAARPNILFLMSDSHDGRAVDPTDTTTFPAQSLPNLRRLAASGTSFVRAYSASPQCTPSRASMFTGRRTDQIKVWANGLALAAVPGTGALAAACTSSYPASVCSAWARAQNVTSTFNDTLSNAGFNVTILGKTHIGADIVAEGPVGFDAPKVNMVGTFSRAASIRKPAGDWRVTDGRVANVREPGRYSSSRRLSAPQSPLHSVGARFTPCPRTPLSGALRSRTRSRRGATMARRRRIPRR